MELDLNDPKQFTLEGVRKLIASKDDSCDRQLRVTKSGIAYLSDTTGAEDKDNLAFRFHTLDEGDNSVGEAASQNEEWVSVVYQALKKN